MASCLTVSVPRRKIITLDRITVVMASCLTLFVPSWNRTTVILHRVVMGMASCLTVIVPRRKKCINKRSTEILWLWAMPDLVCSQSEQNSSDSRQDRHGHGQFPDRERAEEKTTNAKQNYCGYGQLSGLVCSQLEQNSSNCRQWFSWLWPSCLTVSGPSRKILTLDRITVVIASCLTSFVPNWNRSAVIRYSLFMVMASCLTVSVPSRRKAGECTQRRRI